MLIVDRIEDDLVLIETDDGVITSLPLSLFDGPVREGDCLRQSGDRYEADLGATETRRTALRQKYAHLWKNKR